MNSTNAFNYSPSTPNFPWNPTLQQPLEQHSALPACSLSKRARSSTIDSLDSDAVPKRLQLSPNPHSHHPSPALCSTSTSLQNNYQLAAAPRKSTSREDSQLLTPRSLVPAPEPYPPVASSSAVSSSSSLQSLSPRHFPSSTLPKLTLEAGTAEAACSAAGSHGHYDSSISMTTGHTSSSSLPVQSQVQPVQSQNHSSNHTHESRAEPGRIRARQRTPSPVPQASTAVMQPQSTVEWTARLWYARHPKEARKGPRPARPQISNTPKSPSPLSNLLEHTVEDHSRQPIQSTPSKAAPSKRRHRFQHRIAPPPSSARPPPCLPARSPAFELRNSDGNLTVHYWIHELHIDQLLEKEKTVWEQFKQTFDTIPKVLVDRRLRRQTSPPCSRYRVHVARASIYFQSITILVAPRDFVVHDLHTTWVAGTRYKMSDPPESLAAYTFDDIYTSLYNYYDRFPHFFYDTESAAVTAEQLVDFRCGNPHEDHAVPWSHRPRPPLYLHEACQWTELPNARIFACIRNPQEAELVVDVQCKRISGRDLPLARMCGVHYSVFFALDGKRKVDAYCTDHVVRQGIHSISSGPYQECVAMPVDGQHVNFKTQMAKSFVYIVRLVACKFETGKPCGSYLVMRTGGWVVPPMEERLRLYEGNWSSPETSLTSSGAFSNVEAVSLPKPGISRALSRSPSSVITNIRGANLCRGQTPEVWTQLADPAVEDVLWMASKLITGSLYKGFREGAGTGLDMSIPSNREFIRLWADNIRYKSPSNSALVHSDMLYQAHLAGKSLYDS